MGEGGDRAPQNRNECGRVGVADADGHEGTFVEVDAEASGICEAVEDGLHARELPLLRPEEEQRVVDVLDDRAGEVVDEGMEQAATRVVHHPMQ